MVDRFGRRALWRKFLLTPLEAALSNLVYYFFAVFPIDLASAVGGWLGRTVGPKLKVNRYAVQNLKRAFPEKAEAEIAGIVHAMWDNLGRVVAEYPHLQKLKLYEGGGRIEVVGAENVDLLRDDGKPGIFFSAHIGNWELVSMTATQRGLPLTRIYRAPNNPLADRLIRRARRHITGELLQKGAEGARRAIEIMRNGGHLGMMVDQKMNDGIAVPFFGRDAMTAPALARIALKFHCPVVPAKVERTHGAHFSISVLPPLELPATGDRQADVKAGMTLVNRIIEGWIRESPEQWLWVHRRWPD